MGEYVAYLCIAVAAIANAAGAALVKYTSVYKAAHPTELTTYWAIMIGALSLLGFSFMFYAYALSKLRLSVAQPLFSVGAYLSVALIAFFVFKEFYSAYRLVGLALLVIGAILIATS